MTFTIGISYALGMLLAPLMDYFDISMPPLVNIAILLIALIFVPLLYVSISRSHEKKLYNAVELEALFKSKIRIQPSSIKHFLNVLFSYIVLLGVSVFFFFAYVETQNVIVLVAASLILFLLLLTNRKTIKEGNVAVKIKE
ncbi:DUF443 family protein [Lentibacillus daqui]|uniref:DUF443 family protein n=1 Tax=Lentibacillus daqui TaxID=2911514 RepID=UPI0022B14BDE|nr:DUF443 family protein [Lentibacillus daqui]